ncbi:hypothetical protein SNEBB_003043 [Seison nebaliae]|nr:hypothetical protein SNEBB_003043 [Seison nebaliae]
MKEVIELIDNRIKEQRPFDDVYEFRGEIGRGKFAVVYNCHPKDDEKSTIYAAKFIKKRRIAKFSREDVLREAAILFECQSCEFVINFIELYETTTDMIIVLERAIGGELQIILNEEEHFSEAICILIMRQVIEAVAYLHERHFLHLDIKPSNILLMNRWPSYEVKLCDFGLAKCLKGIRGDVRDIMGTPDYVAPEVLAFDALTYATDMWSIGVLTYVLLSGYSPFAGDTTQETYVNIELNVYEFPDDIFQHCHSSLLFKEFIQKHLQRAPRRRLTAKESLKHSWLNDDHLTFVQQENLSEKENVEISSEIPSRCSSLLSSSMELMEDDEDSMEIDKQLKSNTENILNKEKDMKKLEKIEKLKENDEDYLEEMEEEEKKKNLPKKSSSSTIKRRYRNQQKSNDRKSRFDTGIGGTEDESSDGIDTSSSESPKPQSPIRQILSKCESPLAKTENKLKKKIDHLGSILLPSKNRFINYVDQIKQLNHIPFLIQSNCIQRRHSDSANGSILLQENLIKNCSTKRILTDFAIDYPTIATRKISPQYLSRGNEENESLNSRLNLKISTSKIEVPSFLSVEKDDEGKLIDEKNFGNLIDEKNNLKNEKIFENEPKLENSIKEYKIKKNLENVNFVDYQISKNLIPNHNADELRDEEEDGETNNISIFIKSPVITENDISIIITDDVMSMSGESFQSDINDNKFVDDKSSLEEKEKNEKFEMDEKNLEILKNNLENRNIININSTNDLRSKLIDVKSESENSINNNNNKDDRISSSRNRWKNRSSKVNMSLEDLSNKKQKLSNIERKKNFTSNNLIRSLSLSDWMNNNVSTDTNDYIGGENFVKKMQTHFTHQKSLNQFERIHTTPSRMVDGMEQTDNSHHIQMNNSLRNTNVNKRRMFFENLNEMKYKNSNPQTHLSFIRGKLETSKKLWEMNKNINDGIPSIPTTIINSPMSTPITSPITSPTTLKSSLFIPSSPPPPQPSSSSSSSTTRTTTAKLSLMIPQTTTSIIPSKDTVETFSRVDQQKLKFPSKIPTKRIETTEERRRLKINHENLNIDSKLDNDDGREEPKKRLSNFSKIKQRFEQSSSVNSINHRNNLNRLDRLTNRLIEATDYHLFQPPSTLHNHCAIYTAAIQISKVNQSIITTTAIGAISPTIISSGMKTSKMSLNFSNNHNNSTNIHNNIKLIKDNSPRIFLDKSPTINHHHHHHHHHHRQQKQNMIKKTKIRRSIGSTTSLPPQCELNDNLSSINIVNVQYRINDDATTLIPPSTTTTTTTTKVKVPSMERPTSNTTTTSKLKKRKNKKEYRHSNVDRGTKNVDSDRRRSKRRNNSYMNCIQIPLISGQTNC